jgi:hypothetical protein
VQLALKTGYMMSVAIQDRAGRQAKRYVRLNKTSNVIRSTHAADGDVELNAYSPACGSPITPRQVPYRKKVYPSLLSHHN